MKATLRWTLLGPLIGILISTPVIWYFSTAFDHSVRNWLRFALALPFAYIIGIPAALMTGLFRAYLAKSAYSSRKQDLNTVAVGAIASTYVVAIAVINEDSRMPLTWGWVPSAFFMMTVGALSAMGMLWFERRKARPASGGGGTHTI